MLNHRHLKPLILFNFLRISSIVYLLSKKGPSIMQKKLNELRFQGTPIYQKIESTGLTCRRSTWTSNPMER